jgi:flagellar hook-associated protein 3 FlgL
MRITTAMSFESGIETLQKRKQDLDTAQIQLTTGKRVNKASDDPAAAARAERALAAQARNEAGQRAVEASRNVMTLTESALGDAQELMQAARELVIAAGNASYSDGERQALAMRLRGVREQLLSVANRPDGRGGYLFAGQGGSQPPFVDAPGGVAWRGTAGHLEVSAGETLPVSTDGQATWLGAPTGNGVFETRAVPGSASAWIDSGRVTDPAGLTGDSYSITFGAGGSTYSVLRNGSPTALSNVAFESGKAIEIDGMSVTISGAPAAGDGFEIVASAPGLSAFAALDQAIAELDTPGRSGAQIQQGVNSSLRDIDSAMGRLQLVRAGVGETLARTDGVESRLADATLAAQKERSSAEDLDMVAAISSFQAKQTGYDAALQSYAAVRRMSLFDYLKT